MCRDAGIPGCGRGRCGRRHPPQAPPDAAYPVPYAGSWPDNVPAAQELSREEELRMLEEEEEMLKQELDDLAKDIEDLMMKDGKEVKK